MGAVDSGRLQYALLQETCVVKLCDNKPIDQH